MLFGALPPDFSGAGIQGLRLLNALARHGVETQALTAQRHPASAPLRESVVGGQIRRLRVPARGWAWFLGAASAAWLLRHPRWDILHVHGLGPFAWLPLTLARRLGRPALIKTTVSSDAARFQPVGRLRERALSAAYRGADAVVALSRDLEDELGSIPGRRSQQVIAIPNGVDSDFFRPPTERERVTERSRLGLPPDARVVATLGRLNARKNTVALLQAAQGHVGPPVHIVLAGPDGPDASDRQMISAALASLPATVQVTRFENLNAAEVAALLRAADVFALTSRAEGMPNALLEAMASGVACVATDVAGSRDLLARGGGALVPLDDTTALWRTIVGLLDSPSDRFRLGRAARARVDSSFALPAIARRYRALYDSLLEPRPGSAGYTAGSLEDARQ